MTAPPPGADRDWTERPVVRALLGRRGRPLGALVLLLGALVVLGPELDAVRALRVAVFDAYQRRMPREPRSAPALIVEVDDRSVAELGQWPWARTQIARLVRRVAEGKPAAIGLSLLMPEPDRLSPDRVAALVEDVDRDLAARLENVPSNDQVLAEAMAGLPVVIGIAGLEGEPHTAGRPRRRTPVRIFGDDPRPFVREFTGELRSIDLLDGAASGHGLLSVDVERGVVRGVPAVAAVGDALVPTFGLELLRVAAGEPAFAVRAGRGGVEAVAVGDLVIPTQPDGSLLIHYSRPDPARFVSAAEVLTRPSAAQQFEGKLVLIGVAVLGLTDYQATPLAERMSGTEIHAQLLENIFDGSLLSRPRWAPWAEAGYLAAAGLLLIAAVPRLPVPASAGVAAALALSAVAVAVGAYRQWRVLLDAAVPVVVLGGLLTVMLATTLAEAESQRRRLRRQMEREREAAARLAGELAAARRIQMGSLPDAASAFAGDKRVDVYAVLEPAREVGGDLYDFFMLDGARSFFLVGDVSGKGVPGCLFMAVSKSLFKSLALRDGADLGALMREADREIARDNAESLFVTVWAGILDASTGELTYGNAGHDPPYVLPAGGGPPRRLSDGGGPPLCAVEEFPYEAACYRLQPGDMVCVITDGVLEATSPGEELYGRDRLEAVLAAVPYGAAPAEVGEAIRRDVSRFAAGVEPADDLAIVVLRWNGPGAGDTVPNERERSAATVAAATPERRSA